MLLATLQHFELPTWVLTTTCVLLLTPPFVQPAAFALTEVPTGFLLVGSYWLLVSGKGRPIVYGTIAGVLVGLSAMTRPTYQLLGLALSIVLLLSRQAKKAGFLMLTSSLIVGGFAMFNMYSFGYFGVSPALGWHLSTKTVRLIDQIRDERVREILVEPRNKALVNDEDHSAENYIFRVDKGELSRVTGFEGIELDRYMAKLNMQLILSNPMKYLEAVGNVSARYWFPTSGTLANNNSPWIQRLWVVLQFTLVALFFLQLIAVVGTALTLGGELVSTELRTVYLLGLIYIFYTMSVSCFVDVGDPRHRLPSEGIMVTTSVIGLYIWSNLRSRLAFEFTHMK